MTRPTAILLTVLLLMQTLHFTPADMIRFDELLEHARYHEEKFGDDFASFLSKHYGSEKEAHNQEHQEEQQQHEQLPFQQLAHTLSGIHNFILKKSENLLPPAAASQQQTTDFYYLAPISSVYQSGVFQPPRKA